MQRTGKRSKEKRMGALTEIPARVRSFHLRKNWKTIKAGKKKRDRRRRGARDKSPSNRGKRGEQKGEGMTESGKGKGRTQKEGTFFNHFNAPGSKKRSGTVRASYRRCRASPLMNSEGC